MNIYLLASRVAPYVANALIASYAGSCWGSFCSLLEKVETQKSRLEKHRDALFSSIAQTCFQEIPLRKWGKMVQPLLPIPFTSFCWGAGVYMANASLNVSYPMVATAISLLAFQYFRKGN